MKTANELKEIVNKKKALLHEQANHQANEFVENVIAPLLEKAAENLCYKAEIKLPTDIQSIRERIMNILRGNGYSTGTLDIDEIWIMWN